MLRRRDVFALFAGACGAALLPLGGPQKTLVAVSKTGVITVPERYVAKAAGGRRSPRLIWYRDFEVKRRA